MEPKSIFQAPSKNILRWGTCFWFHFGPPDPNGAQIGKKMNQKWNQNKFLKSRLKLDSAEELIFGSILGSQTQFGLKAYPKRIENGPKISSSAESTSGGRLRNLFWAHFGFIFCPIWIQFGYGDRKWNQKQAPQRSIFFEIYTMAGFIDFQFYPCFLHL